MNKKVLKIIGCIFAGILGVIIIATIVIFIRLPSPKEVGNKIFNFTSKKTFQHPQPKVTKPIDRDAPSDEIKEEFLPPENANPQNRDSSEIKEDKDAEKAALNISADPKDSNPYIESIFAPLS